VAPLSRAEQSYTAEVLSPAPSADNQFQGAGFFLLVKTNARPPGTAVIGFLAGEGQQLKGFTIPASAVLQEGSETLVLVESGPGSFKRLPIHLERQAPEGWFITNAVNEPIVITGAQQILSEATKGAPEE
jgi:hypothetical protein